MQQCRLDAYDRMIGLDFCDLAVDGSITKSPWPVRRAMDEVKLYSPRPVKDIYNDSRGLADYTRIRMHELDRRRWLVTQLDQLIATFFLPLPEPLGLKNGQLLASYLKISFNGIRVLESSGVDLAYQSLDEPQSPVIVQTALDRQFQTGPSRQNWSNKATLSSSLLVHQVETNPWSRSGIDAVSIVAHAASGERFEVGDKRLSAVVGDRVEWEAAAVEAASQGIGEITVVEAAVPLRLIGAVPDLPDILHDADDTPSRASTGHCHDLWEFLSYPQSAVPLDVLTLRLFAALSVAIYDIRAVQKAYHAVTRHPITLLTRERLPFILPVTMRQLQDIGRTDNLSRPVIEVNKNTWSLLRPSILDDSQLRQFNKIRATVEAGAFSAHLDLHRESDAAMQRHGDTRVAALLSALAAESMLDELLLHLKWEEAMAPEEAAASWVNGLDSRVKREYSSRLGGNWSFTGDGPVARWNREVAELRHRIVHAAYVPTAEEALTAYITVNALVTFACDRLAAPKQLRLYPRTAIALAGEPGLTRRGSYTQRIRDLQNDPNEPAWNETYERWRDAHSRLRRDATTEPRKPRTAEAFLLAVFHPDGSVRWCLHDRLNHLAVPVTVADTVLTNDQWKSLQLLSVEVNSADLQHPVSTFFPTDDMSGVRELGPWREEYHLVPMGEVMVDKSDYCRH